MRPGAFAFACAFVVSACADEAPPVSGVHVVGRVEGATHAIAVAGPTRTVVEVREGAFDLTLRAGQPTALTFVDGTELVGVWRDGALDTLTVAADGVVDLGDISFDGTSASGALVGDELLEALGMEAGVAATVGALDDLCVRYANPDADGDGAIDGDGAARLELRAELTMTVGDRDATIDDLVGAQAIDYRHVGTAINVRVPDAVPYRRGAVSVTFEAPFHGVSLGAATPIIPAGVPVSGNEVIYGADRRFGVYARAGHDVPRGGYRFAVDGGELAFVEVRPPGDATMAEMMDQVMPFVTLVPQCEDCPMASVEVAWKRRTPTGWVDLTDAELAHVRPQSRLDLLTREGHHVEMALPGDAVAASVPWDSSSAEHATLSQQAFAALSARSFRWVGIQTETAIGLKTYATAGL